MRLALRREFFDFFNEATVDESLWNAEFPFTDSCDKHGMYEDGEASGQSMTSQKNRPTLGRLFHQKPE